MSVIQRLVSRVSSGASGRRFVRNSATSSDALATSHFTRALRRLERSTATAAVHFLHSLLLCKVVRANDSLGALFNLAFEAVAFFLLISLRHGLDSVLPGLSLFVGFIEFLHQILVLFALQVVQRDVFFILHHVTLQFPSL